eukprot:Opistho-2@3075
MGQNQSGLPGQGGPGRKDDKDKKEKKKYEPPAPTTIGKRKKKRKGPDAANKLPQVMPHTRCRLRLLKQERIKDYLLMEEEFIRNQERLKPQEEKNEEERVKVDELRGTPMGVGTLEEIIDDNHAIVSSAVGPEYYVSILSFVDKDQLEPGSSVLLHNKVLSVVGVLGDDVDPMVSVMKLEKAPTETYADIGGLDQQVQEIKESVELPLTHPEYYEEMGIRPPKGVILYGPREQARHSLPRRWQTRRLQPSCASLALSSSKSISVTAPNLSANCSVLPKSTRRPLCLLTRLTLSAQSVMTLILAVSVKFRGLCLSFSTSSTDSTRVVTLRSLWQPTASTLWIPPSFGLVVSTGRLSFRCPTRRRADAFSQSTRTA